MSRSSRPSPFKRSISALTQSPADRPQGDAPAAPGVPTSNRNADVAAAADPDARAGQTPTSNGSTRAIGSDAAAPARNGTERTTAATGHRSGTAPVASAAPMPSTIASSRTTRAHAPMAFEPLKDDAVRRSRKFIGRHKGMLTGPGAAAVDFVRRNRGVFGGLFLVCLLGAGGYLGWQAWESANSHEAREAAAERAAAIEDGSWSALVAYAQRHGISEGDTALNDALERAYREEADRLIAGAESALRAGEPDPVLALPRQLDELSLVWLDLTGGTLPISLNDTLRQRLSHFERQAVVILESHLADSAQRAEQRIDDGDFEPGMAIWQRGKQQVRSMLGAFDLPARDRERLDAAIGQNESGVLRTVERRHTDVLREAYERARELAAAEPMALEAYREAKAAVMERVRHYAEEYGLSESSVQLLERSGNQYAVALADLVGRRLGERVNEARVRASQDLVSNGDAAEVIDRYRAITGEALSLGRRSGLFEVWPDAAEDLRGRIEAGERELRELALREAAEDVQTLQALHLRYESSDPAFAERVAERIRHEYRRAGDYARAAEFGDAAARILAPFDVGMRAYWVERDHDTAGEAFRQLVQTEAAPGAQARDLARLQSLARGYLTLLERGTGSNPSPLARNLAEPASVVLESASATFPLEAFTVGYFQMIRGNFAEARMLLRQAEGDVPPGMPVTYLSTLAYVRGADTPRLPGEMRELEERVDSERDRAKLHLLRFWAHVDRGADAYDEAAVSAVKKLLDAGTLAALLAEFNLEANLSLSESDLRFTLGAIRYFYYVERSAGVAEMRRATAQPFARAASLFGRLVEAAFPPRASTPDVPLLDALRAVEREVADELDAWPTLLVRAMSKFHIGFELPARQAAPHFGEAGQLFDRLAAQKPVFAPVAALYKGRMAVVLEEWVRATTLLRQVAEQMPMYGEVYHWLGDLYASKPGAEDDPEFAVSLFQRAAGLRADQSVAVAYPWALYRLFDDSNLPVDEGVRQTARRAYGTWFARADDLARREFPRSAADSGNGRATPSDEEEARESRSPEGAFYERPSHARRDRLST